MSWTIPSLLLYCLKLIEMAPIRMLLHRSKLVKTIILYLRHLYIWSCFEIHGEGLGMDAGGHSLIMIMIKQMLLRRLLFDSTLQDLFETFKSFYYRVLLFINFFNSILNAFNLIRLIWLSIPKDHFFQVPDIILNLVLFYSHGFEPSHPLTIATVLMDMIWHFDEPVHIHKLASLDGFS